VGDVFHFCSSDDKSYNDDNYDKPCGVKSRNIKDM